jgi:hypothetical protein
VRGGRAAIAVVMTAVVAPLLATAAGAPAGGWSFAHWGMTRSQVRAASHGKVQPPPAEEEDVGTDAVDGDYTFGPYKVAVKLEFGDDHRLSQVDLFPVGDHHDCDAIGRYLTSAYGPMRHDTGGAGLRTRTWTDAKGGNVINWLTQGPADLVCEIDLDPPPKHHRG